jgi:hypothetical protein
MEVHGHVAKLPNQEEIGPDNFIFIAKEKS